MSRRWPAVAAFVALALACASPTLPLPPPETPSIETVDAEHVNLVAGCGGAESGADILVQNVSRPPQTPNGPEFVGTTATTCGSWELDGVFAFSGDALRITQQYGSMVSTPIRVCVPTGVCASP